MRKIPGRENPEKNIEEKIMTEQGCLMAREAFSAQYLQQMNPQQKEAVQAVEGAVLLLAVPGSGKTTVLVTRLGYMILCRNIPPEQILTMTYTKAATLEMAQRFQTLFGGYCRTPMNFSTINSLSNQIIRWYSEWKNRQWSYAIPGNGEIIQIVQKIYQSINGDFPTDSTVNDVLRSIAYIKNQMLPPEDVEIMDFGVDKMSQIYRQYEKTMRASGFMDFDDQMVFAYRILTQNPEVLAHFQEKYPYLCIDESQDTSRIQHAIIRLLTKENLFMVGDEDQSIYGFRAAYPEALLNFQQDYPGARILLMESNYRSSRQIVEASNRFIARNQARHAKTSIPTQGNGCSIRVVRGADRRTQLNYILEVASDCRQETAVLFRNNDSAIPLVDLLDRNHIPFRFRGSDDKFFTHKVVLDLVDMLEFAKDPYNAEIFLRIYYKFGGGISREAALYACEQSRQSGKSILEELPKVPSLSQWGQETAREWVLKLHQILQDSADQALLCLWNTLKYSAYAAERKLDAGKLEILRLLAAHVTTPMDLLLRMKDLREMMGNPAAVSDSHLTISTIHSSKGLEYHSVILMDLFDGVLPGITKAEVKTLEDGRQYEEERRLCYVGMTRAKKELTFFLLQNHPSEFAGEIAGGLPRICCEDQDVFAPLFRDLRGKSYNHHIYGKGKIIAQSDDILLLEFSGDRKIRMTLAEMLQNRAVTYTKDQPEKSTAAASILSVQDVIPGADVTHNTFGPGRVLSVRNGLATIRFGESHGQKTILLKTAIERGFLKK